MLNLRCFPDQEVKKIEEKDQMRDAWEVRREYQEAMVCRETREEKVSRKGAGGGRVNCVELM